MFIEELLKEPGIKQGVDLYNLSSDIKLEVITLNNTYNLTLTDKPGTLFVSGGYFKKETSVYFTGCTFGGTMIKIGWLGLDMHMEFWLGVNRVTTSPVQKVKIISENWFYEI